MIKNILWDFDGVILDSMEIRDFGFKEIFKDFDSSDVAALIKYHQLNGGLSRYVKIRYFFESILKVSVTETEVLEYASSFSEVMRKELINPKNLIEDSVLFIKENHSKFNFHIVSGSDQVELRFLCKELNLSGYFISIHGSPTTKSTLIRDLLLKFEYQRKETCLIGDSINDYDAAKLNDISFYGYNSTLLEKTCDRFISSFSTFPF